MKTFEYYIVDVFTDVKFGGNQLAVFPDAKEITEEYLQKIAREFNFSESTFVLPPNSDKNDFNVRIFTPGREVPTAGHPTIGTAFVLLNILHKVPKNKEFIIFEEKVGDIKITFNKTSNLYSEITMRQPLPVFGNIFSNISAIADILSISRNDIDERFPVQAVSCGNNFLFVPVKQLSTMNKMKVRADLLEKYASHLPSAEVYVFTTETINKTSTTHGRMFAPAFGIEEDPATGSAGGPLGCYLVKYGLSDGKNIICEQGFEMGRPSIIYVDITTQKDEITEIKVKGNAVLVSKGEFYL